MKARSLALTVLAALAFSASASASSDDDRFAKVMEAIAGVCPLSNDPAENRRAHDRAQADGISVVRLMVSQWGTHTDQVTFGADLSFTLSFRDDVPGMCAASFDPLPSGVATAWLTARYGEGRPTAEGTSWIVHRGDGDGALYYRPHVMGQTGPAWVVHGDVSKGEYVFGPGAENDTLSFYLPEQRYELEQLDREFGPAHADRPL